MNAPRNAIGFALIVGALLGTSQTSNGTPTSVPLPVAPVGADVVAGREAFTQYCSICHGVGAKGFVGPYIAGVNWGTSGLHAIVRNGVGGYGSMPAFNADAVTDKSIADIVVYLMTLSPATVPVPRHGTVVSGDTTLGRRVYAAYCAACHGANGQGAVGPELHGEKTRKDINGTILWIKNPIAPMPALYPKPLSEKDVDDVAAFVETL